MIKIHADIIADYTTGMRQRDLVKKYKRHQSTISKILSASGVAIRDDKRLSIDGDLILRRYKLGETIEQIASSLGVSFGVVRKELVRLGVDIKQNRKYHFYDEDFLSSIDADWKGYFLGLLWSDGNMRDHDRHKSYSMKISLSGDDGYVLDLLHEKIFENGCTRKVDRSKNNRKNATVLEIHSMILHHRLESMGCTPNKSLISKFPTKFPMEYFWSFFRGYFDGDGWRRKGVIGIIGSDQFCEDIKNILDLEFGIESRLYKNRNEKVSRLFIFKKKHRAMVNSNMYRGADIFLKRKYLL